MVPDLLGWFQIYWCVDANGVIKGSGFTSMVGYCPVSPGFTLNDIGVQRRLGNREGTFTDGVASINYSADQTVGFVACHVPLTDPFKTRGPSCNRVGNPIDPFTGNKYEFESDFSQPGNSLLAFGRHYNSRPLLESWTQNYYRKLVPHPNSQTDVSIFRPEGMRWTFAMSNNIGTPDADINAKLQRLVNASGEVTGYVLVGPNDDRETYDASGAMIGLQDRAGRSLSFVYSNADTPPTVAPKPGLLLSVVDDFARSLRLTYDATSRLVKLTEPSGQNTIYHYDVDNRLASVTHPDGTSRTYLYNEAAYTNNAWLPRALTGIIDENNNRFATFRYNSDGGAIGSEHAGGVDKVSIVGAGTLVPTVFDAKGTAVSLRSQTVLGVPKSTSASVPYPYCGSNSKSAQVDAAGNYSSRTDFNDRKTCYAYDLTRNLETNRVEGLLSTENCATALESPPNRPDVRRTTTVWHPTFRLPASITEPAPGGSRTTEFRYDGSGNLLQKSVTAPRNDGTGGVATRAWAWTYTTRGRMLTATDPRGKVTTYTYHAETDPDSGKRGNVATITNPLGHVTQFTAYDASARPMTLVDPNGVITNLAYDARGRLTSRTVGGEITVYDYDGVGQLRRVTLPDGSSITYTYDGAHRLTEIRDGLGHRIVYTLDAMGNRVKEEAFDPANTLTRTRGRQFDALNRLAADLGALNQTTTYGQDNNANVTSVTDPLSHATVNSYDALNRLTQMQDASLGITQYAYDPAGNLTQVTDPRNLATFYAYDGHGNLARQASPDTGTTVNTFDAAGNLLDKTDARGVTTTHTYDDLGRVTQILYTKSGAPSETHTFSYDAGANAKGRLVQVTDPTGVTAWTYEAHGRVASTTQTVAGLNRTTAYGYNGAGQLTTMTTPSGQAIGYGYLNNRIASITVNGQSLITEVGNEPFGPLSAWQWGNGLKTFRDYDADGRIAAWELGNGATLIRKEQIFDPASRITAIADPLSPAANQGYDYDVLDRLTAARSGNPIVHTRQFGYDAVGNRQTMAVDSALSNLTYEAGSNRLQTLAGGLPANYPLASGSWTFTYNLANRMVAALANGIPAATYRVNALGQRVRKTVAGASTIFVYDEQGRLLGEYDGSGNLIQETIWLEDLPVATLRPTGSGNPTPIAIYYVHADHLGSPRAITRPADNAMMWQWDNVDPFGANPANENPGGQGTFKYGLRFPGQYFDAETGTHYNYFRDYDPGIGRYVESDPIGLRAGLNTYAYVASAPSQRSDQFGLASEGGGFSTRYGNWCGRRWSGGRKGPIIPQNPSGPIDSVDECCMTHDYCYAKYECESCEFRQREGEGKKECDIAMVDCLDALKGKAPQNWPKPPRQGNEVEAYFFCQKAKRFFQFQVGQ